MSRQIWAGSGELVYRDPIANFSITIDPELLTSEIRVILEKGFSGESIPMIDLLLERVEIESCELLQQEGDGFILRIEGAMRPLENKTVGLHSIHNDT